MRRPLTLLSGAVAGFGLYRLVAARRRAPVVEGPPLAPEPREDPRAEELRRRLAEARTMVEEREEFEAAETPVDKADHGPEDPEARRRAVHEAGRAAAERMRAK